jgi:hypothetical protein
MAWNCGPRSLHMNVDRNANLIQAAATATDALVSSPTRLVGLY